MGEIDMARQAPNVDRMRRLGANVIAVTSGDRTLRAAIDESMRDWVGSPDDTYYLLGSAVGGHPYPFLVRELQSVIGREARPQMIEQRGRLPDVAVACVGGGSNAIGLFHPFIADTDRLRWSVSKPAVTASGWVNIPRPSCTVRPGVLHGTYSMLLQDSDGQIQETHSVSAGLDYPGVGPEHALLGVTGRAQYVPSTIRSARRHSMNVVKPKACWSRWKPHMPLRVRAPGQKAIPAPVS